ncbi:MAG: secretin N-terminal domain-containing protein, partial [Candidatus Omnitrophica bacterium]|nr:secretin N-terminal domain-containing protein [Candidatus Omnitrophota bacterium]
MKKHNILIMSFFLSFVCLYPLCAQEQKDTAVPLVKEEGRGIVTHEASPQPENVVEEPEPTIEEEPTAENTEAENAEEEIRPSTQEEAKSAEESKVEETSMTLETLELKDMDILDILKLISKKSGLNIAAGKNVKGRITIFLKDVNVWDALRIILETNDLAYSQEEGIVKVMTAKEYETIYGKKFTDKTSVKIIPLKFANAGAIVPLLTQIKSAIGKVIADEKSNTVVIIDTPQNITKIGRAS